MATTGLPYYGHCPFTRTTYPDGSAVEELGSGWLTQSIISYQATPTSEQQQLWAGDRLEEISNGAITGNENITLSRLPLKRKAEMTGAEFEDGRLIMPGTPNPPYFRSGAMARLQEDNKEKFRVTIYMSIKYGQVENNYNTKTNSSEFGNFPITGTISANADNVVLIEEDFEGATAYDDALALFRELLNLPAAMSVPTAEPPAGEVAKDETVTLDADEGAQIRYTTNGKDVTRANSTLFTAPIAITADTTIKARAYDPNEEKGPSGQLVAEYTVAEG